MVDDLTNGWLCEQLTSTLSALNSPDDLFNFFDKLRGDGHMTCCFQVIYVSSLEIHSIIQLTLK